jgi:putative FmdB family regulatory protein
MPIFDFCCCKCGHEFEELVLGIDKPVCPKCGGKKLQKQPSAVARRGKGEGGSGSGCSGCAGGSCSSCH